MSKKKLSENQKIIIWMLIFAVVTIILWRVKYGMLILYPFTILSTWFHEMAHGIMALIMGGSFQKLEIFPNGSGYAIWNGPLFSENIGKALVAMAGPLGPTISGAILIFLATKEKYIKTTLIIFSLLLAVSVIYLIRSPYGIPVISSFALYFLFIAIKTKPITQKLHLIFIGIQAFLSLYLSIGYLMSQEVFMEGEFQLSDTAVISQNLFFPYWVWGGLIIFISVFLIIQSISKLLKK